MRVISQNVACSTHMLQHYKEHSGFRLMMLDWMLENDTQPANPACDLFNAGKEFGK